MKPGLILIFLFVFAGFVKASPATHIKPSEPDPIIEFDNMVHDFGTMREGDSVFCYFKFTNKGSAPIIIQSVEQPCGCTVPSWSKEPIMPGKSGQIKVVFHSKERPGIFRKTLAVKTNGVLKNHEEILLMIKGNVLTKKEWKQAKLGSTKQLISR